MKKIGKLVKRTYLGTLKNFKSPSYGIKVYTYILIYMYIYIQTPLITIFQMPYLLNFVL